MVERSDVALDAGLKAEFAARAEDRDAVIADRAGQDDCVARPGICPADSDSLAHQPDARCGDVQPVRFAALDDLGIACHNLNTRFHSGVLHGYNNTL